MMSAVEKLKSPSVPAGKRDLVLAPSNLWLTIHESIGHPTELDRALGYEANYAGTSFIAPPEKVMGKLRVGSERLNFAGDRTALRLCVERVAPARRQAPIMAPIEASGDARAAIAIVADAAAAGVITSAQAAMLARMLLTICGPANGSQDHCDEQSDDAISRDER